MRVAHFVSVQQSSRVCDGLVQELFLHCSLSAFCSHAWMDGIFADLSPVLHSHRSLDWILSMHCNYELNEREQDFDKWHLNRWLPFTFSKCIFSCMTTTLITKSACCITEGLKREPLHQGLPREDYKVPMRYKMRLVLLWNSVNRRISLSDHNPSVWLIWAANVLRQSRMSCYFELVLYLQLVGYLLLYSSLWLNQSRDLRLFNPDHQNQIFT